MLIQIYISNLKNLGLYLIKLSLILLLIVMVVNIVMSIFKYNFITDLDQKVETVYLYY